MVGITEPRRVAATALATRVADERGTIVGDEIGYCIRFDDHTKPGLTKIKVSLSCPCSFLRSVRGD